MRAELAPGGLSVTFPASPRGPSGVAWRSHRLTVVPAPRALVIYSAPPD